MLESRYSSLYYAHIIQAQNSNFSQLTPNCYNLLSKPTVNNVVVPKCLHFYELQNIFTSFMTARDQTPGWVKEVLYYMMDTEKRFYPRGYENYARKRKHLI